MEIKTIQEYNTGRFNKNAFIRYSNNIMNVNSENAINIRNQKKNIRMGIENLQEFSLFPKEMINGRTIITA